MKTKFKIISHEYIESLENEVNKFLEENDIGIIQADFRVDNGDSIWAVLYEQEETSGHEPVKKKAKK